MAMWILDRRAGRVGYPIAPEDDFAAGRYTVARDRETASAASRGEGSGARAHLPASSRTAAG